MVTSDDEIPFGDERHSDLPYVLRLQSRSLDLHHRLLLPDLDGLFRRRRRRSLHRTSPVAGFAAREPRRTALALLSLERGSLCVRPMGNILPVGHIYE